MAGNGRGRIATGELLLNTESFNSSARQRACMKKYSKIRYPNDVPKLFKGDGEIVMEEKMDGANFRFTVEGGEFVFGSKNTERDALQEQQFEPAIDYIERFVGPDYVDTLQQPEAFDSSLVFFGEAMIPHTLEYDDTPGFLGFDVYVEADDRWLLPEQAHALFEDIGLPTVPIITRITVNEWDSDKFEFPESEYGDFKAEGVVLKRYEGGERAVSKLVREDFQEQAKAKSKDKQVDDTDTMSFVCDVFTKARVRKAAYRLRDEGSYDAIKMEMMRDLPREVMRDFVQEEMTAPDFGEGYDGLWLLEERREIDFEKFRSKANGRAADLLKDVQMEEAMSAGE